MSLQDASPPLRYADFVEDALLGEGRLTIDADAVADWNALFAPDDIGAAVPLGVAPLVLMRIYAELVAPRPPGNVHVGQSCSVARMPVAGERLDTRVRCAGKEMRGERRVVRFLTEIRADGDERPVISGVSTIFWAA